MGKKLLGFFSSVSYSLIFLVLLIKWGTLGRHKISKTPDLAHFEGGRHYDEMCDVMSTAISQRTASKTMVAYGENVRFWRVLCPIASCKDVCSDRQGLQWLSEVFRHPHLKRKAERNLIQIHVHNLMRK